MTTKVRTCATVIDGVVCGNPLAPRRKVCDECTLQSIKAANARLAAQRAAGNAPKTRPVTEYLMPQIETFQPYVRKVDTRTQEEKDRLDAEQRRINEACERAALKRAGLLDNDPGRQLSKREIAEVAHMYQPPKRHEGVILPHLRGDYVF